MAVSAPKIDERTIKEILKEAKAIAPFYAPEWNGADEKESGSALFKLFAHLLEAVITRFNQVPHKNFVAFLDMLGIKLLPAQPAKVPLTFKLAQGTEKEIMISARTQAAADKTEEHDELPFETEKNLWAIPSALEEVFSVDPLKDAIYQPPPGFLNGSSSSQKTVTYKIASAPSLYDQNLQLDDITGLKEGDFLKIVGKVKNEFVVISSISGNIVTIKEKLLYAYLVNTKVEKITDFTLFEGKNFQEHCLYIADKDQFNVKSTAQFILDISHQTGTETGLSPLKLSWEYWGEVTGTTGEDWQPFKMSDNTSGLSKSGQVKLNKASAGEIKEKEINSIKSRWIRCLVKEALPVTPARRLPALDQIKFLVKSAGKNLKPDLAFNNDIPLDITKAYRPFGKEPRAFDRFAIASKEIFSKKGAKIEMAVDVEARGILGPPCAIQFDNKIKVFARGTYGRLMEVEIDPSGAKKPVWTDHGLPPDTKIASKSMPSAATDESKYISVFARAKNGHLVERFINNSVSQWIDHGHPKEGINVVFDPAVIKLISNNTIISVFVTGSDGNLYEFNRYPTRMSGKWRNHGKPNRISLSSSPFPVQYHHIQKKEIRTKIFVVGNDGQLYELDCREADETDDSWEIEYGSPSSLTIVAKPYAWLYLLRKEQQYFARVFVKVSNNTLWRFDTYKESSYSKNWKQVLDLPEGKSVNSYPHGYITDPVLNTGIHIFIRSSDNYLYELEDYFDGIDPAQNWKWTNHFSLGTLKLNSPPFVVTDEDTYAFAFVCASSNKSSVLARTIDSRQNKKTWNEHKDPSETALTPTLSWEYWNNKGWVVLTGLKDTTKHLLVDGKITFTLPTDIAETEIAGQKNYWLRARLVGGDFGKETFSSTLKIGTVIKQEMESTKNSIRYPIINKLTISYQLETKQYPQQCLAYNNLDYRNHTEACKSKDKHFSPFVKLDDKNKTLYLGFDTSFKGGPVKIFFNAKELAYTEAKKPRLEWTHSAKDSWDSLSYNDATEALIKREILELIGPTAFYARTKFGNYLHWLKATLAEGVYEKSPLLYGIYPNTTWSLQAETIKDEILGSSTGEPNQTFSFLKVPIIKGEKLWVQETLSEEEKQAIIASAGKKAIYEKKDDAGKVLETWVLWTEVADFFDSTEKSRHYTLDRAIGLLEFGDGTNGMIPVKEENNIKAFSYQAGGGASGNVKAGEIKTLKTAVAGVDKVANPIAADGGAETATVKQMLDIGPAKISHRERAVTAEDFEWLAKQASRKVVKVRCLPNLNNKNQAELGWVTVIIVPDSKKVQPMPSLELRKTVRQYLEAYCANTLASPRHVYVGSPSYQTIGVTADVYVTSIDVASKAEREAKTKLKAFFHPLTGGTEGAGWEFGEDVSASDVYALLEGIEGIDHVENLTFSYNGTTDNDVVEIKQDYLAANGTHTLTLLTIRTEK